MNTQMTISELLKWGEMKLEDAQIADAEIDAWYLLEYSTGISKSAYLCDRGKRLEEKTICSYQSLIEKRAMHIPLQHLTGEQEFMGLPFLVNKYVLIPRQDTECLVEEALKFLKPEMEVLDMCTGSGCILISLAHFCKLKRAVGVDLSKEALDVAEQNGNRLSIQKIEFVHSDLFDKVEGKFDCIISNPPYIASDVIETLEKEVKEYEPRMALDGMEDGLFFYKKIISQASSYLKKNGRIYLEIGYDQAEDVSCLLKKNGFEEVQVKKDLAGLDRLCCAKKGRTE